MSGQQRPYVTLLSNWWALRSERLHLEVATHKYLQIIIFQFNVHKYFSISTQRGCRWMCCRVAFRPKKDWFPPVKQYAYRNIHLLLCTVYVVSSHYLFFSPTLSCYYNTRRHIYQLNEGKYDLKDKRCYLFLTFLLTGDFCQDVDVQIFICLDFMFTRLHGVWGWRCISWLLT